MIWAFIGGMIFGAVFSVGGLLIGLSLELKKETKQAKKGN